MCALPRSAPWGMALSRLGPCAQLPARADRRVLYGGQMQLPLHARRPGTWWDAPVTIQGVTTTPSRAVRGKIYERHPRFRSPSDRSCFLPGPRPPVPRRSPWNPSVRRGERRVARTAERTGSGVAYCTRGLSWHLPQGKFQRRGYQRQTEARQQDNGEPGPTAARTPKREIGCTEHRTRLRGTQRGRGRGPGHPTRPRLPPED
jgi:hypothetical protein